MFWDIYYDLCKRAGKSATTVCLEIGLSNSAANGWKMELSRKQMSSVS